MSSKIDLCTDKDALIYHIDRCVAVKENNPFYERAMKMARALKAPPPPEEWNVDRDGKQNPGRWIVRWEWKKLKMENDTYFCDDFSMSVCWVWLYE